MSEFKTAYSNRVRFSINTGDDSLVQQSFKKECDINHILKKYQKTGLVDHVSQFNGKYDDVSQGLDYHNALNVVLSAQAAFESLPSSIRKQFSNNPGEFLNFVENPANYDKMVEMGLINPVPEAVPAKPVAPQEPAEPEA